MNEVIKLSPWEVVVFPWGTAVRHVKGEWTNVFISPTGREIDVTGLNVELTNVGIKFTGTCNKFIN